MEEVTHEEFWKIIGPMERVSINAVGNYPYTTHVTRRGSNELIAKVVPPDKWDYGKKPEEQNKYYLIDKLTKKTAA